MAALQLLLMYSIQYNMYVGILYVYTYILKNVKSTYICINMCLAFTFILNHLVWIFKTKFWHH